MYDSEHNRSQSLSKKFLWHLTRWVRHLFNHLRKITYDPSLKESVLELMDEYSDTSSRRISLIETNIVKNTLEFGELSVGDLMTPRADIAAVSDEVSLAELKSHIRETANTRIPVYHDNLDKIVGFIHIKDVFLKSLNRTNFDISSIIRKILVIPAAMKAADLLAKMQTSRVHIAIIVDEFGGVDGLITIEDLIEAIIGQVEDEHDTTQEEDYTLLQDGSVKASARLAIEELEELMDVVLHDEEEENDFDTVGGLVFYLTGHVPTVGEVVKHHSGLIFKILEADPRRIITLLITKVIEKEEGFEE